MAFIFTESDVRVLSPEVHALLVCYTKGVNAALAEIKSKGKVPVEFSVRWGRNPGRACVMLRVWP
jgi:hypothetical protein